MNGISILDASCTVILKLAVALVLLALSRLLLALAKPKPPQTVVWANSTGVTTGSSGPAYQFLLTAAPAEIPAKAKEEHKEPEKAEPLPQVVCGNCNNEIKTEPIEYEPGGGKIVANVYTCESCGMRVRMPLAS